MKTQEDFNASVFNKYEREDNTHCGIITFTKIDTQEFSFSFVSSMIDFIDAYKGILTEENFAYYLHGSFDAIEKCISIVFYLYDNICEKKDVCEREKSVICCFNVYIETSKNMPYIQFAKSVREFIIPELHKEVENVAELFSFKNNAKVCPQKSENMMFVFKNLCEKLKNDEIIEKFHTEDADIHISLCKEHNKKEYNNAISDCCIEKNTYHDIDKNFNADNTNVIYFVNKIIDFVSKYKGSLNQEDVKFSVSVTTFGNNENSKIFISIILKEDNEKTNPLHCYGESVCCFEVKTSSTEKFPRLLAVSESIILALYNSIKDKIATMANDNEDDKRTIKYCEYICNNIL